MKHARQGSSSIFANMEAMQFVYEKLNTSYPGKVTAGLKEGKIDDSILLWEIDFGNKETKENQRVGQDVVIQITHHANTIAALYSLYDTCVSVLVPDVDNVSSCFVTERLITSFDNGLQKIDIRVKISN